MALWLYTSRVTRNFVKITSRCICHGYACGRYFLVDMTYRRGASEKSHGPHRSSESGAHELDWRFEALV